MSLTSFLMEYNKRKYTSKYSVSNLLFYGSLANMIRNEHNRERKKQAQKKYKGK